jgi:mRNA-degrading endonuclease RelE of RelBE toxin-antitoxin system
MKHIFLPGFTRKLEELPLNIQGKFFKQLRFLLENLHYPSLRAKKYGEARGTWQVRVDQNFRFYFFIKKDTYILLDIKRHPK